MRIISAIWTPEVNMLQIKCECGRELSHRADRWKVVCPKCGAKEGLWSIRERYLNDQLTKQDRI